MSAPTSPTVPMALSLAPPSRHGDRLFRWLTATMAGSLIVLFVLIGFELWAGSALAREAFGLKFLTSTEWSPTRGPFGALPFIFGTVVSSGIALLFAVPLSIGTAIYLTELAPSWVRQPLSTLIEMLAAIPSVILGLWAVVVLIPWLSAHPYKWLNDHIGPPFFSGTYGFCLLSAGLVLAIMVLPIITAVAREILRSVPTLQREAAYALGATRWEVTRIAVLSYARPGLFGATILGLGRALGETMAVALVIGNQPKISASLLDPSYTLASIIANQFGEANEPLFRSTLIELGLVLFLVTILINLLAQLLLKSVGGGTNRAA